MRILRMRAGGEGRHDIVTAVFEVERPEPVTGHWVAPASGYRLLHPESGETIDFRQGDRLPDWALAQISSVAPPEQSA